MNSLASALGFAAIGVFGAAAVSAGVSTEAVTQTWGIAEAWRRFARPLTLNVQNWLKGRRQELLPEPTSPRGCADDRIQSTALSLREVVTQDGVSLEAEVELIWHRLPVPRGRSRPQPPSLKDCSVRLQEVAESALQQAFRARPLADLLLDRPALGAAVCLALRPSLREQGLWLDTCELEGLNPPREREAEAEAESCIAMRLVRAVHRRAGSRARQEISLID